MPKSPNSTLYPAIRTALSKAPLVAFAVVFGSSSRRTGHATSDIDVALGLGNRDRPTSRELGAIVSRLEEATGRTVDVVILEHAPPGLAYRVFRDGDVVLVRERAALVECKTRAILEYLDFLPIERACSESVLSAGAG